MKCFREGRKDVMVATDVASKGLDFPDIQHVINFDMPEDIENYGKEEKPSCWLTLHCSCYSISGPGLTGKKSLLAA